LNNYFPSVTYNTHNGIRRQDRYPCHPGARDPVAQRDRRGFLFRRCHVLDGPRPMGHQPNREGAQKWWYPVRSDCDPNHTPLHRGLYGCLRCVHPRFQTRSTRLRGYPVRSFRFTGHKRY